MNNNALVKIEEQPFSWDRLIESGCKVLPHTDVFETNENFVMKISLAGVESKDVRIKLENSFLHVFGKMTSAYPGSKKYILSETGDGNYYRKFKLSDSINLAEISAEYSNGLLSVVLPKKEEYKPRIIIIE